MNHIRPTQKPERCSIALKALSLLLILLITALAIPTPVAVAQPQSDGWIHLANPQAPGGNVAALALAPSDSNVMYTLINGQLGGMRFFRSQDAGASWLEIHFFPLSLEYNFNNLAVDPANPQIVYASGGTSLQRSTDGGETWQQANPLGENFTAVSSSRLYAAGWTNPCGNGYSKVYNLARSDDDGETWQTFPIGCLDQSSGGQMAVLPAQPDTVYLSIASEGTLLKSTDAGQTWNTFSPPIYDASTALLIDPANPQRLFASGTYGILRSEDGGETWQRNSPQSMGIYHCLAISGGSLYAVERTNSKAPVYRSDDGGTTWWQSVTLLPAGPLILRADPAHPGHLWGGLANYGIYLIGDSGGSWVERNAGIETSTNINALAVSPGSRNIIYAAVDYPYAGVYKTLDGGMTWSDQLPGFTDADAIPFQSSQPFSLLNPRAVATWYPPLEINQVLIHPLNPDIAWAATSNGMYETLNGLDWQPVYASGWNASDLMVSAAAPDQPYAMIHNPQTTRDYLAQRVCVTQQTQCYWKGIDSTTNLVLYSLIWVDPTNSLHLLVTGQDNPPTAAAAGIYQSLTGGTTWEQVGQINANHALAGLELDPGDRHIMVAVLADYWNKDAWLNRSIDGGITWQDWSEGAPYFFDEWHLALDELGTAYLGTTNGTYRRDYFQASWEPLALQGHWISAMVYLPPPSPALLAAGDGNFWRLDLPQIQRIWLPLVREDGQ